ncbi:alpha/beta hydrolase [Mycobacterium sp. shizuoka-1]|uniref:alpha/beta hydrolase n=1 Tax=Mycobacterium sp. shizuoka-1 TaxID=2039281 RepID=UPI0018EE10C9|nr:alpha/beta hydrolase [Mycobacterium sp. shizuoka-1]
MRFSEIPGRTSAVSIPTRYGGVAATIYHPPHGRQRPPVYVNIHGGGFVVGHPEQDDPWCRYLAAHAGVAVVNPDYVLAPDHRFPAAPQQIYDIVCWAAEADRQWDGTKLCVGGQSAGGNLAAAAARQALERGGPDVALQVLFYAPLDLVTPARDKPSTLGARAVLKPWMGTVFDTAYIPDIARRHDRLASPARDDAGNLAGIAPALVITAEQDRLRDEARLYAEKLHTAGSLAEYYEAPGVDHGYNIMSSATEITRATYEKISSHVVRATTNGEAGSR